MSFAADDGGAIVFDAGSASFRAGYAGDDMPKVSQHCRLVLVFTLNLIWFE